MTEHKLFRKYFMIFSLSCISCILVLGVVLLGFASRYFREERYKLLERNARNAALITARNYESNNFGIIEKPVIATAYGIFAISIDAEIFLTDMEGNTLYCASPQSSQYEGSTVPREIVTAAAGGVYRETGRMGGFHAFPHYTVGVPVVANSQMIGILFASSPAESLSLFLRELLRMFLFSAAVVMLAAAALIYLMTARLVRPLRDMLHATQSFSQGDFTKRVPVNSYDEIGQLAMAFNNMASTLATTESARRSFVANVSHELKTPMTTISGFVDGILDGTVPAEKQQQYLQIVSNEVKRLSRLVRSMLDTARIEAGEMHMNPVAFDISETVRQTIFSFEQLIEEKRLSVEGLDTDRVMVMADKDLMHQVVYNLVENAVKFIDQGGVISFAYRTEGQRTCVAIRNTGEGLDKEEAPMLFERFYKSDKSRSLNKNGAGLGLHIVKSIINYHNGEILVRSVKGQYTEFEFFIPSAP